jgi:hypothetical protein
MIDINQGTLFNLYMFYLRFLFTPEEAWWKKLEYPERTTDHGQATGKLYHFECTLFCKLQSWARTHTVLVIGLCKLLGNPTT